MSLLALPEELLSKISSYSVAAQYYEDEFTMWSTLWDPSDQSQLIRPKNRGVEALSSTNSTLRRICLADLFSHMVLAAGDAFVTLESLRRLLSVVIRRPQLLSCQYVQSIHILPRGHNRSDGVYITDDDELKLLTRIIPHLPQLSDLPCLSVILSESFINTINAHTHIQRVYVNSIPYLEVDDGHENARMKYGPEFLKKILVDHHYPYDTRSGALFEIDALPGMGVKCLWIQSSQEHMFYLDIGFFDRVESIRFCLEKEDGARLVGCALDLLRVSRNFNGLTELTFEFPSSEDLLSDLAVSLPLLGDIVKANRDICLPRFLISSYTLTRRSRSASSSSEVDVWTQQWQISAISFRNSTQQWITEISQIHSVLLHTPHVRELTLGARGGDDAFDITLETLESLAFALTAAQSLSELSLDRCHIVDQGPSEVPVTAETRKEIHRRVLDIGCRTISSRVPTLDTVRVYHRGADFLSYDVKLRRRMICEGGGVDTFIIS